MAIGEITLSFMGVVALLGTIGLFLDFGDAATRAVVGFAGSVVWFTFGISAFDVVVDETGASSPMMPLVFLGIALGAVVALFSLNVLRMAIQGEVEETATSSSIFN